MEATVLNVNGAWLGISPQKNTRYVRLLCETEGGGKYYHDLWLTEKTEERSLKQLLEYGFTRELVEIGELDDGNEAKDMFIVPDGGVPVILKTEEYAAKGTGELKSITKIDCTKAQQFKAKGVDKLLPARVGMNREHCRGVASPDPAAPHTRHQSQ